MKLATWSTHTSTLAISKSRKRDENVVVFNTGSGIKYLECYE